jgi:hypothetical protein
LIVLAAKLRFKGKGERLKIRLGSPGSKVEVEVKGERLIEKALIG